MKSKYLIYRDPFITMFHDDEKYMVVFVNDRGECAALSYDDNFYCVEEEKSIFREEKTYPRELRKVEDIVIQSGSIGRYQIFQMAGTVNDEIIVTEQLKEKIESNELTNVHFYELKEES